VAETFLVGDRVVHRSVGRSDATDLTNIGRIDGEVIGEAFIRRSRACFAASDVTQYFRSSTTIDEESFSTARELLKGRGHPRRLLDRHAACRSIAFLS